MLSVFRLWTVFLALPMLAGCGGYSWKQKMTVEVETPSGVVSGSSVAFVRMSKDYNMTNAFFRDTGSAEATVVKLPGDRYLFALLKPLPWGIAYQAFRENFPPGVGPGTDADNARRWLAVIAGSTLSAEVPREAYPLLVTFTDINDPKTVRRVDPDDLAATFGPGVSLRRITLETTDEPITESKVSDMLPWWVDFQNKQLDGNRYSTLKARDRFANSLNRLHFKAGG